MSHKKPQEKKKPARMSEMTGIGADVRDGTTGRESTTKVGGGARGTVDPNVYFPSYHWSIHQRQI